jgi:hypothetical protein
MKMAILALIALASASAFAGTFACGQPERDSYEVAIERCNVGEVTYSDIEQAHLASIQADYDCKLILKGRYCYEAIKAAQFIVDGIKAEEQVGQKTYADVLQVQAQLAKYERICAPGTAR